MPSIEDLVAKMASSPQNVTFTQLQKVCTHFFGAPRIRGSHHYYSTPWHGDPIVNIQQGNSGKAKKYQVKQVLTALRKLENNDD